MNCNCCGNELPDGTKFCGECGNLVGKEESIKKEPTQAKPVSQVNTDDIEPKPGTKYAPMSTLAYIGSILLMSIPILGLVVMIIWACGGAKKINRRNLARAMLVFIIIQIILAAILGAIAAFVIKALPGTMELNNGIDVNGFLEEGFSGASIENIVNDMNAEE